MVIAASIIATQDYHTVWSCAKIEATLKDPSSLLTDFPGCADYANGSDPEQLAIVRAGLGALNSSGVSNAANAGAGLDVAFGMSLWLALAIHAIGVEIYLHLTPKEAQRLRQVSYQRQLEAGMHNPGSAGLTADRLGDADKWTPGIQKRVSEQSDTSTLNEVVKPSQAK